MVALALPVQGCAADLPLVQITRHHSALGQWEMASATPDPRLHGLVRTYTGFTERATSFASRLEVPSSDVTFIVNLGSPFRILGPDAGYQPVLHGSFLAAMHDRFALAGATGPAECLEVKLTPIGAHRLLALPMHELSNRTVALDDLLGPSARMLEERLAAAPSWAERFALMDAALMARLSRTRAASPGVVAAWAKLRRTHGCTDIGTLAGGLGWSRKHLIARFRKHIGLPPKTVASILRFNRAVQLMDEQRMTWGALALASGYYDQAHMIRDFRRFAGLTPTEFLSRRLPGGGVLGD